MLTNDSGSRRGQATGTCLDGRPAPLREVRQIAGDAGRNVRGPSVAPCMRTVIRRYPRALGTSDAMPDLGRARSTSPEDGLDDTNVGGDQHGLHRCPERAAVRSVQEEGGVLAAVLNSVELADTSARNLLGQAIFQAVQGFARRATSPCGEPEVQ